MRNIPFIAVTAINIASQGKATQSTTKSGYVARYAIDGKADGDFRHHSCTLTYLSIEPWWKLTFEDYVLFEEVVVTNRADCCGKFLSSVVVANTAVTTCPYFSLVCRERGVLQVKSYLILDAVVIINIIAADAIPERHERRYLSCAMD